MTTPYWSDETCTLYLGDCREVTEWLDADVLVTDPPYGIAYSTNTGGQFTGRLIAGDATEALRDGVLACWGDGPAVVFGSHKQRPYGTPHPLPLIFDKGDVVGMGDLSWPWRPSYEVELFAEIIAKAPPGTVADPFAGSGSTLVAAKRLGRRSIGVEIDERYCEVAARRLSQGVLDFGEVGA